MQDAPTHVTKGVPGRVTFVLETHATANLIYQLDCLAEHMPCSTEAYRALWQKLGWTADDAASITEWKRVRERFHGELHANDLPAVPMPVIVSMGGSQLPDRQRWAGLDATSIDDFGRLVDLVSDLGDAERLQTISQRFEGRFLPWWNRDAAPKMIPFVTRSAELTAMPDVRRIADEAVRFYDADVPQGMRVPIHFVYRPNLGAPHTHGEMVGGHAVVEVLEGERPEERMAVVLHELFHVYFARMPLPVQASMWNAFAARSEPHALASAALLNEALATALGNGLIDAVLEPAGNAKRRVKPLGLYGEPAIDEAARSLLRGGIDRALFATHIADPAFVAKYVQDAASVFPEGVRPVDTVRILAMASNGGYGEARRMLRQAAHSNDVSTFHPLDGEVTSMLRDNPRQTVVLFVTPKEIETLAGFVPKPTLQRLVATAKKQTAFVDATPRGIGSYLYSFVAKEDDATRLVQRFTAQKALFEGVMP